MALIAFFLIKTKPVKINPIPNSYSEHTGINFQALLSEAITGSPIAQYRIGVTYSDGLQTAKDYAKALHWINLAANEGLDKAQNRLGLMYLHGLGVNKSPLKALYWFEKAAKKGYPEAQLHLGQLYYYGDGVKKNASKGLLLIQLAASKGNFLALQTLAQINAIPSLLEKANRGEPRAQMNIAMAYFYGHGMKKNYEKALNWWKKAANNHNQSAMIQLKLIHSYDTTKSLAQKGNTKAQLQLANYYLEGKAVPQNTQKAVTILEKLANIGNVKALYGLGMVYYEGNGIAQNLKQSFELIEKAAHKDYPPALVQLGYYYDNGITVKKNPIKAIKWYKKAAFKNYAKAQYQLAQLYYRKKTTRDNKINAYVWFSINTQNASPYMQALSFSFLNLLSKEMTKSNLQTAKKTRIKHEKDMVKLTPNQ
jgi:uncharacterized protein